MKTSFTFLLCLLFATVGLLAQPTLTREANFAQADDQFERVSSVTLITDAGPTGANVTWNFSNLQPATTFLSGVFQDAAGTPNAANFPTANLAEVFSTTDIFYYNTSTEKVELAGFTSGGTVISYTNPQTLMEYPFTYGDSFTDNAERVYAAYTGTITTVVEADGYGTLVLPSGVFPNILRVKSIISVTDMSAAGTFSINDELYEWYSQNHRQPIFSIRFRTTDDNGTITNTTFVDYANIPGESDEYGYTWDSSEEGLACNWNRNFQLRHLGIGFGRR